MAKFAVCSDLQYVTVTTGLTPDTTMTCEVISGTGTYALGAADEVDLVSASGGPSSTLYRLTVVDTGVTYTQDYWLHAYDSDAEAVDLTLTAAAPASK